MSWSDVLRVLTAAGIRASDLTMSTPEATALAEALERARVVAVLDGWAEKRGTLTPAPRKRPKRLGGGYIVFTGKACRGFMGESRDAARAAAARAIEAGEV